MNITKLKIIKNNVFGSEILITGDNSDNEDYEELDSESDSDNDFFYSSNLKSQLSPSKSKLSKK